MFQAFLPSLHPRMTSKELPPGMTRLSSKEHWSTEGQKFKLLEYESVKKCCPHLNIFMLLSLSTTTLADTTCQVVLDPVVSLTRCQHFMLSSIIETLVLVCSSCVGFCELQSTPHKWNMPRACSPYSQSGKVSAFHAQFYHWDVGTCMFIMCGLLRTTKQPSQTKHAKCLQPL